MLFFLPRKKGGRVVFKHLNYFGKRFVCKGGYDFFQKWIRVAYNENASKDWSKILYFPCEIVNGKVYFLLLGVQGEREVHMTKAMIITFA